MSKTAIVTGGARGIGRGCALELAARGYDIALVDLLEPEMKRTAGEIEALGRKALTYQADVVSFARAHEVVADVARQWSVVDFLLNDAGASNAKGILEIKEEEFDRTIAVNLKSCFNYIHAIAPIMLKQETGGRIVSMSSLNALSGGVTSAVSKHSYAAAKAGIRAGDIITHLDDEAVQGLTLNQAVEKMRGQVNTKIRLKVMRKGLDKPLEVTIVRDVIRVRSVRSKIEGEDIGYIRISSFNEQTTDGLKKAITDITAQIPPEKLKGYVIDLRNNPGGLLDQAISVSDTFLERGEIVSTRGRDAEETQRFNARAGDLTKGKPLIVLINGGSASASEIVAGALQDQKRATIVGTRSFGKGSVQTIIPLGSGNGALRLTTARYFTPSGKSIQAKGITPDIEVLQEVPEEVKARASTETKGESSLRGHLKAEGDEQAGSQSYVPPETKDDKALNAAFELLRGARTDAAFPPNPKGAVPN